MRLSPQICELSIAQLLSSRGRESWSYGGFILTDSKGVNEMVLPCSNQCKYTLFSKLTIMALSESYKVYHIWESGHIVKLEMNGKVINVCFTVCVVKRQWARTQRMGLPSQLSSSDWAAGTRGPSASRAFLSHLSCTKNFLMETMKIITGLNHFLQIQLYLLTY